MKTTSHTLVNFDVSPNRNVKFWTGREKPQAKAMFNIKPEDRSNYKE